MDLQHINVFIDGVTVLLTLVSIHMEIADGNQNEFICDIVLVCVLENLMKAYFVLEITFWQCNSNEMLHVS